MTLPSLKNLDVKNKTVLLRADFNVAVKSGRIEDDFRIRAALPTIENLLSHNAKIVIISHFDRPKGWDESKSLLPAAERLAEILGRKFIMVEATTPKLPEYDIPHLYFFKHNILETNIQPFIDQLRPSDIVVLENLRFYPQEEENDPTFAEKLGSLGEVYINEAFSNCHRSHASIVLVPKLLPSASGLNLEKEINVLEQVFEHPQRPLVAMMGGIKLSDKAQALEKIAKIADYVLLGGGLANLFLKIRGWEIGKSIWEEKGEAGLAKELWRNYKEKIKLPIDVVVSTSPEGEAECVKIGEVKPHQMILDIGPKTILEYSNYLRKGQTLLWAGPLGYIENRSFSHGTFALARLFAARTKTKVFGVAGGGETLEVINKLGLSEYIDHVSTGGGAMLDFLAGKTLPGLKSIETKSIG